MVPILLSVPAVYVAVLEQVKLNVAKSMVPAVCAYVVQLTAPANVVVSAPLFITKGPIDLPFATIVPVPTIVAVKLVYTPDAVDNVKLSRFNVVAATVNAVVPKSSLLNQPPVVNVCTAVPLPVNVKLGLLVVEPPVVPKVYVLVISAAATNPPVPVQVKLVAFAMLRLTCASVVVVNIMLPDPNVIARTPVPLLPNTPVLKLKLLNANVPAVKVYELVVGNVSDAPNVTVPLVWVNVLVVNVPPL